MKVAAVRPSMEHGTLSKLVATRCDSISREGALSSTDPDGRAAASAGKAAPSDSDGCASSPTRGLAGELHRQVLVEAGGRNIEVDEALAPLFSLLWEAGIETVLSCQCHPLVGKVWIAFVSGRDAERFLSAVLRGGPQDEWARAEHWYFGAYEPEARALKPPITPAHHPAGWEFHASVHDLGRFAEPSFAILVDVLFPPEDLARVVERVRRSLGPT